jgi:hypothetical protein
MRKKIFMVPLISTVAGNRTGTRQISGQSEISLVDLKLTRKVPLFSQRTLQKLIQVAAIALFLSGLPCGGTAQTGASSWANVTALHSGQKILVTTMNSVHYGGTFLSASETTIMLEERTNERSIQKQDVRLVKLMRNEHRLRNTLIGAAVGGGTGAGVSAAVYHPCTGGCIGGPGRGGTAAIGAALGLIGGAVTGALWPSHEVIYRADGGAS